MKNVKLVTVYITTKNRKELLLRCVNSIVKQTYPRIQLIIVDDASDEKVGDYINNCKGIDVLEELIVIRNEISKGACFARNLAIEKASGEFITGCDDDDYFHEERVEKFVKHWIPQYSFICAKQTKHRKVLSTLDNAKFRLLNILPNRTYQLQNLLDGNIVGNQVFTLTSRLRQESFDINLPALQDYELWIRLVKKFGPFRKLTDRLQYIDTSHTAPRITNMERRLSGLDYIIHKHGYTKSDFALLQLIWKAEFNCPLTSKEKNTLLKSGLFRFYFRVLLKR